MKRNTVYAIIWGILIISGAVFLGLLYNPLRISSYARYSEPDEYAIGKLKKLYSVSFVMEKAPSGNIVNYLPRLSFAEPEQIRAMADLWGISGEFSETENQYSITGKEGLLAIDKFGDRIVFTGVRPPVVTTPCEITDDDAIRIADEFMKSRLSFFNYEETVTSFDAGIFEVMFIERLGNLKNFGFPATVRIDSQGNVFSAEHYFLTYDKLDSFPIKSMADAYYNLPLDIDTPVDLKKCTLVYYYRHSILQPCYLFEGERADGKSFRAYVPASIYSSI